MLTSIPSVFAYLQTYYFHTLTTISTLKGCTLYKGTLLSGMFATLLGALGLFACTYLSQTTLHRDECSIWPWWVVTISLSYCLFVCMYWQWSIYILTGCDNVLCARTVAVCIARHFLCICKICMACLYRRLHYAHHDFWHKGNILLLGYR